MDSVPEPRSQVDWLELQPSEIADIQSDFTRHYSNLRFIILPLFGVAVGAPVLFAHTYPIGKGEQAGLAIGVLVGAAIFASMLMRAQMLIDHHSRQLFPPDPDTPEGDFKWMVVPKSPAAWGRCFRVLTGIGCVAVAVVAAFLVLEAPTANPNPPTFVFCHPESDLLYCQPSALD